MKMYLISDNIDTYTGMRLAGVEGTVVHERAELKEALEAVKTVKEYKERTNSKIEVIFNVFKETDFYIYRKLLGAD